MWASVRFQSESWVTNADACSVQVDLCSVQVDLCSVQVDLCSVQGERDRKSVLIGSCWCEVLGSRFGSVAKATSGDSF